MKKEHREYAKRANWLIHKCTCLKEFERLKEKIALLHDELCDALHLDKQTFIVTCDEPLAEDEKKLLRKAMEITKGMLVVSSEALCGEFERLFPKKVYCLNASNLYLAFASDVHIFLHDGIVLNLLKAHRKAFSLTHPLKIPYSSETQLEEWRNEEKLRFYLKERWHEAQTTQDFFYLLYGNCMQMNEIEQFLKAQSTEKFYFLLEKVVHNPSLMKQIHEINYLDYLEHEVSQENLVMKNATFIDALKEKIK